MSHSATTTSLQIGSLVLETPFALAPMAGMTDTAFRRLVKRLGGCGLVVTEMVSAEGLVRGLDRTLEYAEFTEEERPVAIQLFGGDPCRMAEAAAIVEHMGADLVDVNMGCPVPKVTRQIAGCGLMREPTRAAAIVRAMVKAVRIPVTVKMRAGWDEAHLNAPEFARMMEEAGAAAVAVHGRTAVQGYRGTADWTLIARVAAAVRIPVWGSGDCVDPADLLARRAASGVAGVLVGRGALRNPWIFAQAAALARGGLPRPVTLAERGRFLLDYLELLLTERVNEAAGFRHHAPGAIPDAAALAPGGRADWVANKVRALAAWYTKGLEGGSALRASLTRARSLGELRALIEQFFFDPTGAQALREARPLGMAS
jgi:tRNA-dihydrouridine synthase B